MSSYYPNPGDIYDSHFGKPGHLQLPMSDQWREHPGPLDPTSSPSSPYSPASSLVPSPMMPRGSPTVTRHLKKFGDLALDNEHPISSGISQNPIGSPSHQQLEVDNLQLLGPSIARRNQALSIDKFQGEHHMSMIDKHGLEYRSSPQRSQGSHRLTNSNPHVPPIPTTPDFFELFGIEGAYPDSEFPFDDYKPTTADITVSASNNTANVGLSTVNDDLLALGFSSHLAVPQFDIIPGLPLTAPHEAQLEYYLQQSPPVKQVARGSGSKDSESVLKYYYQHFKNTQPLLRRIDQQFKKEVGSFKTVQASLNKRKEDGHWTCPIGCTNFTRKQNLKHHLQSHLGIREFDCSCGSSFNALSGLKRHQKKCRTFNSSTSASN